MAQIDNIQDKYNTELYLRTIGYRASLLGYNDDPNDAPSNGAGSVLRTCPAGTLYQRDSNGKTYVKTTSSATSWVRLRTTDDI